jgi:hypothetical protein
VHSQITGIFIHFKHDWLRANKANKFCLLWGSRRAVESRKINVISLRVDSRELAPLQIFVGSISVNNLVKNFRDSPDSLCSRPAASAWPLRRRPGAPSAPCPAATSAAPTASWCCSATAALSSSPRFAA